MSKSKNENSIIFAIYPNASGYGFVYMKNARNLIDYGSIRVNPVSNRKMINRIKRDLIYLNPSVVIVQNPNSKSSRTGSRVIRLINRIVKFAEENKLSVFQYSRDQIREVFNQFGVSTKYEISQLLLSEFTELESVAPKKRKLWTSEDRYMAIFDALSLAIVWYYVNN